jgi:cell division septum initiation protein DivIVA
MDILRLLDQLNDLAVEQPKQILGTPLFWGLNTDEVSMQIAKVRASLPQELKVAASTARESDRILEGAREDATMTMENARKESDRIVADARKEAERIIEQAKLQQERMVAESEVLKLSKAQSEEIRNAADRDAVQMRRGAEKYAYDVLSQLEGVVGKVMTTIERGKQEMQRNEQPEKTPQPAAREKVRA